MATYNIYQLRQYAKKFLADTYGIELDIPLQLNGRMQRTCGWFRYVKYTNGKVEAKCIELNKYFVENNKPELVLDVLRHELVHFALFRQGKPYKDGYPVFERELKRLGVISQSEINKYGQIESKTRKQKSMQVYKCIECEKRWNLKRALQNHGAFHKCQCGGKIAYLGKVTVNG